MKFERTRQKNTLKSTMVAVVGIRLSQSMYRWREKVIINKSLFAANLINILYQATVCCLRCFESFKIMNNKLPKRMNLFSIEVFR